jgi:hypothetical protein
VIQQLQHRSALVRTGQATPDKVQIINFYFYFHHQLAGLEGILFSRQRKALTLVGN